MNADLFEKVKKSAEHNKRSIAKEMEYMLEYQVKKEMLQESKGV